MTMVSLLKASREVLSMKRRGLTPEEIAEAVGIPLEWVITLTGSALCQLEGERRAESGRPS